MFPDFKRQFIDTGKIRYVLREMITEPQSLAIGGFLLARAQVPTKYFDILLAVFKEQPAIYEDGDLIAGLDRVGAKFGLTHDQVQAAITNETAFNALRERIAQARADGVNSVPSLYVNGAEVEGVSLEDISAAIVRAQSGRR